MCSYRKNPYPPQGRSSEIPRRRGLLNAKILEAKYEAKLEFPEGRGGGGSANQKPYVIMVGKLDVVASILVCLSKHQISG